MSKTPFAEEFGNAPDIDEKGAVALPPEAKELGKFKGFDFDDPDELLEYRFLCRGGGLLLVGPTGVGKSSFVMQCAVLWAIGEPAFGIRPSMPLRILIIQAENDYGDLAEMRQGVMSALNLNEQDREYADQQIFIATENVRSGIAFTQHSIRPLLEKHQPALLIINPALAYLGGDTNSQEDVGGFLRNQLNPLLTEFSCGCIVVNHTNKPPSGLEKSNWQAGDFAHLGSGSAEWSNWARAVLARALPPTRKFRGLA
jgi:RecA-family ATPase